MFASIAHLYNLAIYIPLYNGLIGLMDLFPWMDAGVAIIVFTIIIRLILFPLARRTVKTQIRMREIQPEILEVQKKIKDKQEQFLKTNEIYKKHNIHPFSSTLLISIIQLPILIALNTIFRYGLTVVNSSILYSFIHIPNVNIYFLDIIDITKPNIFIAVLVLVTQFLQMRFSLASQASSTPNSNPSMQASQKQMQYFLPVMIFSFAVFFPAALSIYWAIGNLFMLGQELFVRFHHEKGKQKAIGLN